MKGNAAFYYIYNTSVIKLFRLLIFYGLLGWSVVFLFLGLPYKPFLFIFLWVLMFEAFFKFKVARFNPKTEVANNKTNDPYESMSIDALSVFEAHGDSKSIIKDISKRVSARFILHKADILEKDFKPSDGITAKDLADYSLLIAKAAQGKYITTSDVFVAYLILSEDKTKLLFNKKLKKENMMQILLWTRSIFRDEEEPKEIHIKSSGEGIAESWVYGWTIETQKYMIDMTQDVIKKKQIVIGREEQYKQIIEALYKNHSVMLVGEPGSGKRSVLDEIMWDSFEGKLSHSLFHQRFYQLMIDNLLAGAGDQGEFEKRLDTVVEELTHAGNVVIYVSNFENLLGASTFQIDLSGALLPYIEKGTLRIIGTVTEEAYKKYVEPRKTLTNAFEVVRFDVPDESTVLVMLFKKAYWLETKLKIPISYRAITASYQYASKYSKDRVLPGAAVVLLEDSANTALLSGKKIVEEDDVLAQIERKTNITVGEPKADEKKLLLNLEQEMHKRLIDQEEAVTAIAEAMRRVRTGLVTNHKPISFLFLGPTGVGKTETAKTLSSIYFKSEDRMLRFDMSEYRGEDGIKKLLGAGPGDGVEKGVMTEKIYDNPFSLVLLDEFEKADQQILDLFLQVLDDGRLTDSKGKTVSFENAIVIATSNAGSEYIREQIKNGKVIDKTFQSGLLDYLQTKGIFKPELLNRFDGLIVFKPLGDKEILLIIDLILKEVTKKLIDQDIEVKFDQGVVGKIAKEGYDQQFGARPLRRFIQDNIEDSIAQKILKEEIKRGDKINLTIDSSNNIVISK